MRRWMLAIMVIIMAAALVPGQSVQFTAPVGGEQWVRGAVQNVKWNLYGYSGEIRLVLLRNGNKVGKVTKFASAANHFAWTVGKYDKGLAPAGKGYRIRINLVAAKKVFDSPGDFQIIMPTFQKPDLGTTATLAPQYRVKRKTLEGVQFNPPPPPPPQPPAVEPEIIYFRAVPTIVEPGTKVRLEYHYKNATDSAAIKIQTQKNPVILTKVTDLPKGADQSGAFTVEPRGETNHYYLEVGTPQLGKSEHVMVTVRVPLKIFDFHVSQSSFPQQSLYFYYHIKGAEEAWVKEWKQDQKGNWGWQRRVQLPVTSTAEINTQFKYLWPPSNKEVRVKLFIISKYGVESSPEVKFRPY